MFIKINRQKDKSFRLLLSLTSSKKIDKIKNANKTLRVIYTEKLSDPPTKRLTHFYLLSLQKSCKIEIKRYAYFLCLKDVDKIPRLLLPL